MSSSLVSFSKRDIHETLPGLQFADYHIYANPKGAILHVEDSSYYKPDLDGHQDSVFVPSQQIVESIVHMHKTSQLAYKEGQHPALFCVPNKRVTMEQVEKEYKELLNNALSAQRRWFIALVKIADDDWQRAHVHQGISDIQRIAARELGLKRDWLMTVETETDIAGCPFCGTNLLNPEAPICPTCGKIHNPVAYKALEAKLGVSTVTEVKKVQ